VGQLPLAAPPLVMQPGREQHPVRTAGLGPLTRAVVPALVHSTDCRKDWIAAATPNTDEL